MSVRDLGTAAKPPVTFLRNVVQVWNAHGALLKSVRYLYMMLFCENRHTEGCPSVMYTSVITCTCVQWHRAVFWTHRAPCCSLYSICIWCCSVKACIRKAGLELCTPASSQVRVYSDTVRCFERTRHRAAVCKVSAYDAVLWKQAYGRLAFSYVH
jgi:hypothetical protein